MAMAAKTPRMTMTTTNSTKVKPEAGGGQRRQGVEGEGIGTFSVRKSVSRLQRDAEGRPLGIGCFQRGLLRTVDQGAPACAVFHEITLALGFSLSCALAGASSAAQAGGINGGECLKFGRAGF